MIKRVVFAQRVLFGTSRVRVYNVAKQHIPRASFSISHLRIVPFKVSRTDIIMYNMFLLINRNYEMQIFDSLERTIFL